MENENREAKLQKGERVTYLGWPATVKGVSTPYCYGTQYTISYRGENGLTTAIVDEKMVHGKEIF